MSKNRSIRLNSLELMGVFEFRLDLEEREWVIKAWHDDRYSGSIGMEALSNISYEEVRWPNDSSMGYVVMHIPLDNTNINIKHDV